MIKFDCPNCDEEMEIADRMAGRKIECVNCAKRVRVPDDELEDDDEEFDDRPPRRSRSNRPRRKHETKSKAECKEIAGLQKAIMACIVIYLLTIPIVFFVPESFRIFTAIGYGLIALVATILVFALAVKVNGPGMGIVFGFLTFIPCIGLITLLVINGKATAVLQENGYSVGLFGVPASEFH